MASQTKQYGILPSKSVYYENVKLFMGSECLKNFLYPILLS